MLPLLIFILTKKIICLYLFRCMRYVLCALIGFAIFSSCKEKKDPVPDVSDIEINTSIERFDKDLFAIDTTNMEAALNQLQTKYGTFLNDYLYNILALPPQPDTITSRLKSFIKEYKPVQQAVEKKFTDLSKAEKDIHLGLQLAEHYFPGYKAPSKLITFVGPVEGYGSVLTQEGLAIGLQLYLGQNYEVYHSQYITEVYPEYQQRRFEPQYIPVNSIKNIVSDIYPEKNSNQPLVYQMIDAGKRLYMLDHLLPETADSLKTGYTQQQLDGCYENEAMIWNFFVRNNLLFVTDPLQTRDYMVDGPRTEPLGQASPGFIGQFVGWQIVKKWMHDHKETSMQQMMNLPEKKIYDEAQYKPR